MGAFRRRRSNRAIRFTALFFAVGIAALAVTEAATWAEVPSGTDTRCYPLYYPSAWSDDLCAGFTRERLWVIGALTLTAIGLVLIAWRLGKSPVDP